MSTWQDRVDNTKFSITTGDGKIYYPLWRVNDSEKNKDYNTTKFDFINVPGSLVERRQPQGAQYPLIFYFQGADSMDKAVEFETSSNDNRFWTVVHPFFGTIKGQPVSITLKPMLNITQIEVPFWESIDVDYPSSNFSVKDNTLVKKNQVNDAGAQSFASSNVLETDDIEKIKQSNLNTASAFTKIQTNETASDYQNTYAQAQKSLDSLIPSPYDAIIKTQALLNAPATYNSPVQDRLTAYYNAFVKLGKQLETLADKYFFETQGAAVIAGYAEAAVNPIEGDYTIVPEVSKASVQLREIHSQYLSILDGASISGNDYLNVWQPDPLVQRDLNDLVIYTIANLYELAFEAQQERIVYTDKDTQLILLVHRYMGLDANDENIKKFSDINNIKLKERFEIKKGREIRYYV